MAPSRAARLHLASLSLVAAALLGAHHAAHAGLVCEPVDRAGAVERCTAELAPEHAQALQVTQEQSRWCWAAVIAMVFARHGYNVPQQEIVERWFGTPANLTIRVRDLPNVVNRDWYGDDGRQLRAKLSPVSGATRPTAAGTFDAVDALAQDEPVILVTGKHAVVLYSVTFERSGTQVLRFTGGRVVDPLPGSGPRSISSSELREALVARVAVGPAPASDFISTAQLLWKVPGGAPEEIQVRVLGER